MLILKTKNEDFFKEWSFKIAYILGFFAADGNVVCGFYNKTLSLRGSLLYNSGWRLSYSTNDSRKLYKFMYSSATIFLDRKNSFLKDSVLAQNANRL